MLYNLSDLMKLMKERRSLKPEKYSSRKVHKEQIERMLEAANWAPNHGNTEPWRFKVYSGEATFKLLSFMGELYKKFTPEEKYLQNKYDNFIKRGERRGSVILVYRKRDALQRVPDFEEDWAVACAVQNLSLMAAAYGIGCFWSTPKMIFSEEFKVYTQLESDEAPMGVLFLGYPEGEMPEGRRNIWINKVTWIEE
ncbi:MAG TPA: nitroreductase [Bacteroidia bacterium]